MTNATEPSPKNARLETHGPNQTPPSNKTAPKYNAEAQRPYQLLPVTAPNKGPRPHKSVDLHPAQIARAIATLRNTPKEGDTETHVEHVAEVFLQQTYSSRTQMSSAPLHRRRIPTNPTFRLPPTTQDGQAGGDEGWSADPYPNPNQTSEKDIDA